MCYSTVVTKKQGYLTSKDVLVPPYLTAPPNAWSGSATGRYIVPGPNSYGGARDWRKIWLFVNNKLGIM